MRCESHRGGPGADAGYEESEFLAFSARDERQLELGLVQQLLQLAQRVELTRTQTTAGLSHTYGPESRVESHVRVTVTRGVTRTSHSHVSNITSQFFKQGKSSESKERERGEKGPRNGEMQ